jgi:predicted transcriptional regulator
VVSTGPHAGLSRREREIVEILLRRGDGTVSDVRREMADPPGYSAVRATLAILERKGFVRHAQKGQSYLYRTVTPRRKAVQGAVQHLLITYFDNSLRKAVAALLEQHGGRLTARDFDELERLVRDSRKGRNS